MAEKRTRRAEQSSPTKEPRARAPLGKTAANGGLAASAQAALGSPSPLRGLVATPSRVARLVAQEVSKRPMTEEARQRLLETFTLQYYFGGWDIAYRRTEQGVEVLAVDSEIGELFRRLSPEAQRDIVLGHPEPW